MKMKNILLGGLTLIVITLLPEAVYAEDNISNANTAWILTSTALVLFMTLPGLAFFYGGLVRSKNVLSVLMQCFSLACLVSVMWVAFLYSLAFGDGGSMNSYIGGLDNAFLSGITINSMSGDIPETVFIMFQLTFAIITPALIVGGFAERMKFSSMFLFSLIWMVLGTDEITHITGFPIGTEGNEYLPASKRTYLIGDAAGLAETLLGEGIYNAVISGKYIANSIVGTSNPEDVYHKYSEFLIGMKKELALYNRASKILYKKQRMSYWMLKLFFGKKFMNGYSEGKTLTEIIKGKYPFPST